MEIKKRINNHLILWILMVHNNDRAVKSSVHSVLKRRLLNGEIINPADYPELDFVLKDQVKKVADRVTYAKALKEDRSLFITNPIVDKKLDLIFDCGAHSFFLGKFYAAHKGELVAPPGYDDQYILEGFGYYYSSVHRGSATIGRELFRKDALDEYDQAIIGLRGMNIVDSVEDLKQIRY